MVESVISLIRIFSGWIGDLLSLQIELSEDTYLSVSTLIIFVFLLFAFVKFAQIVTNGSVVSKKG